MNAAIPLFNGRTPLEVASDLAANYGIPVFVCRNDPGGEKDKAPLTENGFKDATLDQDGIEYWLRANKNPLVAVPTGKASRLLVVDIDPKGAEWYREHQAALACGRVHRSRRGWHLVYRYPEFEVRNSASKIAPGVDVRGEGGYVIWWPAHGYDVVGDLDELNEAPAWLLKALATPTAEPVKPIPPNASIDAGFVGSGGRNEYLSREAYRLRNQQGFSVEQILDVLKVLNTSRCSPPLEVTEVEKIAKGKARVPVAAVAALDLRSNKHGIIADEENVLRILVQDPALQGVVRFNEFSNEMIAARPIADDALVISERGMPRPWTDSDTVILQTHIQRFILPRVGRDKIESVLGMYARTHCAFHPLRDYLQALQWDGVERLPTWLSVYMGADEQPGAYLAAVGTRFLISAVARVQEPGCQVDSALVLEGQQGIRKSTGLRVLAGDEFFSDSLPADLSHKDSRDHLRGKWIIELPELAQFKRGDIETIKAYISRRTEQYRPSYGRHEVKFPRQCVFAGTTNADEYLVDQTGNRRFWVVACKKIDLDGIKRDRDQLWAEAMVRYRRGESWFLNDELAVVAAAEAQSRVAHDPWTAFVSETLNTRLTVTEVSPGEVLSFMNLNDAERNPRNGARVAQILRDLGWRKAKRHMTRGQIYVRDMKL